MQAFARSFCHSFWVNSLGGISVPREWRHEDGGRGGPRRREKNVWPLPA